MCLKEGEVWRKVISNKIIVTLVTKGLPSFSVSRPVPPQKKADSVPTILLGIDYEWSLMLLLDISTSEIQERVSPSSRVAIFTRTRAIRPL